MKKIIWILLFALWLPAVAGAQQVVDRTVARVGDDVITESEVVELGRFQQLVDGKTQTVDKRLQELAEQWIVNHEASLNNFQAPSTKDVQQAFGQLEKHFGSSDTLEKRIKAVGLSEAEVRQLLRRQVFLSNYLDYKFRPEVQVDEQQIRDYYGKTLVPELKKAGQSVPPLESVADKVRKVLVEKGVSERAASWLDEMQQRWKLSPVGSASNPSE